MGPPADDYQLPAPDMSLDPTQHAIGETIYPKRIGFHGAIEDIGHLSTRHEWALVDIFFGRGPGVEGDAAWQGPTAQDIKIVTAVGGRVLYHFHVPGVRARVVLSKIPQMVEGRGSSILVSEVANAAKYDLNVQVELQEPFPHALDRRPVALIGGCVQYEHITREGSVRAFDVVMPDQSIPQLPSLLNVDYILHASHRGSWCLSPWRSPDDGTPSVP